MQSCWTCPYQIKSYEMYHFQIGNHWACSFRVESYLTCYFHIESHTMYHFRIQSYWTGCYRIVSYETCCFQTESFCSYHFSDPELFECVIWFSNPELLNRWFFTSIYLPISRISPSHHRSITPAIFPPPPPSHRPTILKHLSRIYPALFKITLHFLSHQNPTMSITQEFIWLTFQAS